MFLYYFSIPIVLHHLLYFLTMPLIKLWSNNLLTVYYSIPSLRWCTLWQLVMVHISPWFANFIDPNMPLNQIILIRKYFIKHFIAFYFCVAYIICRYLQFLALACFYFQGLKAIYTCFLRITDLFVCFFIYPYLLWNQSFFRQDSEYIKEVIKPFDWTFTTDYRGTLTDKNKMTMKVKIFFTLSLINT